MILITILKGMRNLCEVLAPPDSISLIDPEYSHVLKTKGCTMASGTDAVPIATIRVRPWIEMADALENVLNLVVSRGVPIDGACRLREYVREMRTLDFGQLNLADERFERVSQIRSDVDDIVSAVEHLQAPPEVAGWETLFRRIQSGPVSIHPHWSTTLTVLGRRPPTGWPGFRPPPSLQWPILP